MSEKDLEKLLEMREKPPWGVKCSFNMKKKIQKHRREIRDIAVAAAIKKVNIQASDQIPDHLIFFCSEGWDVYKMVNLKNPQNIHRMN